MIQVAKSKKMEMEISRLNDENTRQSTLSFQLRQGVWALFDLMSGWKQLEQRTFK